MKALYLCKTQIQAFPEQSLQYPLFMFNSNLPFKDIKLPDPEIPKQRFEITKKNEYELTGLISIERNNSGYYWDNEAHNFKRFEKYYEDMKFKITKPESFRNTEAEDVCILETTADAAKTLYKLINRKGFQKEYSNIYLKKVEFNFPNKISSNIKKQLKGLWLNMAGKSVSSIGIFGGNVESEDRVESLEESAESISAVYFLYRHSDREFMYMISKEGTILFYEHIIDLKEKYEIAFNIFKIFKPFISQKQAR